MANPSTLPMSARSVSPSVHPFIGTKVCKVYFHVNSCPHGDVEVEPACDSFTNSKINIAVGPKSKHVIILNY